MKHKRWIALLLAAALTVGALGVTAFAADSTEPEAEAGAAEEAAKPCRGKHGHKARVAEPENALGKEAAREAALADAGLSAEEAGKVKVRLVKLEDGAVAYRVSFTVGEQWRCCKLDAVTGEILEWTEEDAAAHEAAKAQRSHGGQRAGEAPESEGEAAGHGRRHGGGRHRADSAETQSSPEQASNT